MTGGFRERVTMGRRMERDADAGSGVVRVITVLLFPSWQKLGRLRHCIPASCRIEPIYRVTSTVQGYRQSDVFRGDRNGYF